MNIQSFKRQDHISCEPHFLYFVAVLIRQRFTSASQSVTSSLNLNFPHPASEIPTSTHDESNLTASGYLSIYTHTQRNGNILTLSV